MKAALPSPPIAPTPAPPAKASRGRLRRALRVVAWLLLAAAIAALLHDIAAATRTGSFRLAPLGEIWFKIHRESYLLLGPAIERHIWKELWQHVVQPVMEIPATLVLAAISAPFFLATIRRRPRAK